MAHLLVTQNCNPSWFSFCYPSGFALILESANRTLADANHSLYEEGGTTELMRQSATGDIEKVKAALDSGVDPNEGTINGYTALMFAAEHGNLTVLKMLLDYGADVGTKNVYGLTALLVAAQEPMPNRRIYLLHMENQEISYVGEGDHTGVIDYLISIEAPIYESLGSTYDAEYTARAYFNIAQRYHQDQKYALAQDYYGVAQRSFSEVSRLYGRSLELDRELDQAIAVYSVALTTTLIAHEVFLGREAGLLYSAERTASIEAAGKSGDPDLLWLTTNQERAILVGVILECYANENPDEGLTACLEWALAEIESVEDQEDRALQAIRDSR